MVGVVCKTYNQSNYIEETMHGFTMQQTSFPFVCCIIDDASTDGEGEVIRKYVKKNFEVENASLFRTEETGDYILWVSRHKINRNCFFAVYFLKYNHYSMKKSKSSYLSKWDTCKYLALCEGDDYWISCQKLQKQVSFLKVHSDYAMVCCRAKRYSQRKMIFMDDARSYDYSRDVEVEDVVLRGGGFIPTCSMVYRTCVTHDYPDYCLKCHVGDWPLQIMCIMKGKVYYDNDAMVVYRIDNPDSWTCRYVRYDYMKQYEGMKSEVLMLEGFAKDYPLYRRVLLSKAYNIIAKHAPIKMIQYRKYNYYTRLFRDRLEKMDSDIRSVFVKKSSPFIRIWEKLLSFVGQQRTFGHIL